MGITDLLVLILKDKEGKRDDDNRERIPDPAIVTELLQGFKQWLGFIQIPLRKKVAPSVECACPLTLCLVSDIRLSGENPSGANLN